MSSVQIGPLEAMTIDLEDGAGGRAGLSGDYVYGDHREPYREAGMWGLLRVRDNCAADPSLRPLTPVQQKCSLPGGRSLVPIFIALGVLITAAAANSARRR